MNEIDETALSRHPIILLFHQFHHSLAKSSQKECIDMTLLISIDMASDEAYADLARLFHD